MTRAVVFPFVGDVVGGNLMSTLLLARGLDPQRYRASIVLHREGPIAEHLRRIGIAHEMLPLGRMPGETPGALDVARGILATAPRLIGWLRRRRPALVHANDLRTNLAWGAAARLAGVKLVWHQRAIAGGSRLSRAMALAAAHVICISRAIRDRLHLPAGLPASVVDNPFEIPAAIPDRGAARARLLAELGLPAQSHLVGFVGRFVEQKRPLVFVAAARALAARRPDARFVMFADAEGPGFAEVAAAAADLVAPGRLVFGGHRHPIEPALAGLDVLATPSFEDGFGRTLVEAAACGTPVVASRSGGHLEVIEHGATGLLVPPDDPASLCDALAALLDDEARAVRLGAAAFAAASARFSAAAHAARVMAIYDSVLSAGRAR